MKLKRIGFGLLAIILLLTTGLAASAAQAKRAPTSKKAVAQKVEAPESGDESDEVVPLSQVPKVVRDTLAQYAKEFEVKTAAKGDVDGTIVYEFGIEQGTHKLEVSITPKGMFFGSEEIVQLADVPVAARATLSKQAEGGKLISVEKAVDKNKKVTYEGVIEKGGKQTEYQVDINGKVVGTEVVPPKKG